MPAAHGPEQRRDLGDHAAHDHLLAEQVARAGEHRAGGLLHARAGGVEQPHERDALGQRQLAQARDLELAGHAHRAGHHGEVVCTHGREAAVHLAVAGDHAVGGRVDAVHRALGGVGLAVDAQLHEGAVVHQQRDPLARGQGALLVLLVDLLLAAAEADLLATGVQILDQRAQERCGLLGAHRPHRAMPCARAGGIGSRTYILIVPSTGARASRRRRSRPRRCPRWRWQA